MNAIGISNRKAVRAKTLTFLGIVLLGCFYIFSFSYFLLKSNNFIVAGRIKNAFLFIEKAPLVSLPLTIDFSDKGNFLAFRISGFSKSEKWGAWTDGSDASLCVKIDNDIDKDLNLTTDLIVFLSPSHQSVNVDIAVNGFKVGNWHFTYNNRVETQSFVIPKKLLKIGPCVVIQFHIDSPASPYNLGLSSDARLLGLGFKKLHLDLASGS